MKHSRKDYDTFIDLSGRIGEDEPVFVLRAKDGQAYEAIDAYYDACKTAGADSNFTEQIEKSKSMFLEWQKDNAGKVKRVPDSPSNDNKEDIDFFTLSNVQSGRAVINFSGSIHTVSLMLASAMVSDRDIEKVAMRAVTLFVQHKDEKHNKAEKFGDLIKALRAILENNKMIL